VKNIIAFSWHDRSGIMRAAAFGPANNLEAVERRADAERDAYQLEHPENRLFTRHVGWKRAQP